MYGVCHTSARDLQCVTYQWRPERATSLVPSPWSRPASREWSLSGSSSDSLSTRPMASYPSGLDGRQTRKTFGRYIDILLKSLQRSESLQSVLINLSGGNARRALELMRRFADSPHSDAEEILRRNEGSGTYLVPAHVFLRAALLGEGNYYSSRQSLVRSFLTSRLGIHENTSYCRSCLGLLIRAAERTDSEGYVPVADIYSAFQIIEFVRTPQSGLALRRATEGEPVDSLPPDVRRDPSIAPTHVVHRYLREFST